MEVKLSYAFGVMGLVGILSSIYHIVSGRDVFLNVIAIIVCAIFVSIAAHNYGKRKFS